MHCHHPGHRRCGPWRAPLSCPCRRWPQVAAGTHPQHAFLTQAPLSTGSWSEAAEFPTHHMAKTTRDIARGARPLAVCIDALGYCKDACKLLEGSVERLLVMQRGECGEFGRNDNMCQSSVVVLAT